MTTEEIIEALRLADDAQIERLLTKTCDHCGGTGVCAYGVWKKLTSQCARCGGRKVLPNALADAIAQLAEKVAYEVQIPEE